MTDGVVLFIAIPQMQPMRIFMRYFIFLVFLTFAIPASAGELVDKYLNKKDDVYLESAYAWCTSAGALEVKRRLLSFVYGERSQDRDITVVRNLKTSVEYAEEDGNTRLLKRYKKYRPLLDEAQNCHDLAVFEEKAFRFGKLKKSNSLKDAVLGDENEKTYLVGPAFSYCSDSHLNDIKAKLAARWYEGLGDYFYHDREENWNWLGHIKRDAAEGVDKADEMIDILENSKEELFSQTTCVDLRNFINAKIRPFAQTNYFW